MDDLTGTEDDAAFVWLQAAVQEILAAPAQSVDPVDEAATCGLLTA